MIVALPVPATGTGAVNVTVDGTVDIAVSATVTSTAATTATATAAARAAVPESREYLCRVVDLCQAVRVSCVRLQGVEGGWLECGWMEGVAGMRVASVRMEGVRVRLLVRTTVLGPDPLGRRLDPVQLGAREGLAVALVEGSRRVGS